MIMLFELINQCILVPIAVLFPCFISCNIQYCMYASSVRHWWEDKLRNGEPYGNWQSKVSISAI